MISVVGTSGGQHLQSSANDIVKGAGVLEDYQVYTANSALEMYIFIMGAVSVDEESKI